MSNTSLNIRALVTGKVKDQQKAEFIDFMTHFILPGTKAFPGCLSVEFLFDLSDESVFFLIETWASRNDFLEKYMSWRMSQGDIEKINSFLADQHRFNCLKPETL